MEFHDLKIYQLSNQLTIKVYSLTKSFPKTEIYGLSDQLKRASSSIGANIAEGYGRYHKKDKIRFLHQARGSLYEVQHFLILSHSLKYINSKTKNNLLQIYKELAIGINAYIKSINKNLSI